MGVSFGQAPFYMSGWFDQPAIMVAMRDITDGTNSTLMFSEVVQGQGGDLRGYTWWGFGSGFYTYLMPNTSEPDVMQYGSQCRSLYLDNPPCVEKTSTRHVTLASRSRHPGGVQSALCDGSVRFFSDNIQLVIWRALGTSGGGEVIDSKNE
jgi:prepilin-type processing-associated H-X9-DG protein